MSPIDPQTVLSTMSPTMTRALATMYADGPHSLHGREIASLTHRGLIRPDPYGGHQITHLGRAVINHARKEST